MLGDRALTEITPGAVRAWYAGLVRSGGPNSLVPAKCYRLVHAIFETARKDGIVARNPCMIDGGGAERSPERPTATLAQVWALADAVPPRYRALVVTAAFAGLRFGELAALKRSDIDLEGAVITVDESLVQRDNGDLQRRQHEVASRRPVVQHPDRARSRARGAPRPVRGSRARRRAFIGEKGGLLRRSNWHTTWEKARTQVGLPGFRLHDLRHTCNTLTAATGASTRELMHRMGHASPRAALRYQHATRERDVVIAAALNDLIEAGPAKVSRKIDD